MNHQDNSGCGGKEVCGVLRVCDVWSMVRKNHGAELAMLKPSMGQPQDGKKNKKTSLGCLKAL